MSQIFWHLQMVTLIVNRQESHVMSIPLLLQKQGYAPSVYQELWQSLCIVKDQVRLESWRPYGDMELSVTLFSPYKAEMQILLLRPSFCLFLWKETFRLGVTRQV